MNAREKAAKAILEEMQTRLAAKGKSIEAAPSKKRDRESQVYQTGVVKDGLIRRALKMPVSRKVR